MYVQAHAHTDMNTPTNTKENETLTGLITEYALSYNKVISFNKNTSAKCKILPHVPLTRKMPEKPWNSTGNHHCSSLLTRTTKQSHVVEDTPYFGCREIKLELSLNFPHWWLAFHSVETWGKLLEEKSLQQSYVDVTL